MLTLFGEPAEIAGRGTIGPINRRLMRDWLAGLERLVRRLLLLAALGLALAPVRAVAGRMHARLSRLFPPDNPAAWPACLRLFRAPRHAGRSAATHIRADNTRPVDARPFALRLEALRRILASPDRRIRLVARTLARIRARSTGANSPHIAIRPWLIPAARRTDAQDAIHDAMLTVEPLIEAELARRHEPG
jgi:hypothetical protein